MKPTIRQLEYLIALKNAGSFSDAALEMHVTQSTLSAGIKELEDILGQPIAYRGKRKITLTPFGKDILNDAQNTLHQIHKLMERAQQTNQPLTGPLRLGIIPTIAPYLLPKILPVLQKECPNLELQIFEDLSERITEDAQNNKLDIILMAFPYPTPNMIQTHLWSEEFVLATTIHQKPKKKSITLKDLEQQTLLLLEDGHCLRDHALKACNLNTPKTRKTFSATSLPTLIQMVANGYGATLLPKMVADSTLPAPIKITPFQSPKPTRDIGMARKTNTTKSRDFEILAKIIKKAYKTTL